MVNIGDQAPDFTLEGAVDGEIQTFTLSEVVSDRPAMLAFYIYDYSPVCSSQMCEINDMEFLTINDDVAAFGISTDGPYSHREFAGDNNISYPLLTDDRGMVYESFGMVDDDTGEPRRGIVVVDPEMAVRYKWVASDNWDEWQIRPLEEAIEAVRSLVAT